MPPKLSTFEWAQKARQIHKNEDGTPKYSYSKVWYKDAKTKVTVTCPKHGDFQIAPNNHSNGHGCYKCGRERIIALQSGSFDEFIGKASDIHKNPLSSPHYNYSKVKYSNTVTKVSIICSIHGEFRITPKDHLRGQGCKKCGYERNGDTHRKSVESFINEAVNIHGDVYDYSHVIYESSARKVCVVCRKHGKFLIRPNSHLRGQGCAKCGNEKCVDSRRWNVEEFVARSRLIHGDRYDYTYSSYVDIKTKVEIICKKHGTFSMSPVNHIHNQSGCPACNPHGHSKLSLEWLKYIEKRLGRKVRHAESGGEFRIPGTKYRADGYVAETGTVLEFHGDYWHGNPKLYDPGQLNQVSKKTFGELYEATVTKRGVILSLGYTVIEIWESDWLEIAGEASDWDGESHLSATLFRESLYLSEPFELPDPGFDSIVRTRP